MKVFLTGRPGIGKTTIVKKFAEQFPNKVSGFWTEEFRDRITKKRKGFLLFTTYGQKVLFSGTEIFSRFKVGKYGVDLKAFEDTVVPLLKRSINDEKRVIIIDEIGKMELFSREFCRIVEEIIFSRKNPVLGTIPFFNVHPIVSRIRNSNELKIILLDTETRDKIFGEIVQLFRSSGFLE